MPSPQTRVPRELVSQARQAHGDLRGESDSTVIRIALAVLAGLSFAAAKQIGQARNVGGRPRKTQPVPDD